MFKLNFFNIKSLFLICFSIFNLFLYFSSIYKINHLPLYFTIFFTLSFLTVFLSIRHKSFFFEKFFSTYMWLAYSFFYCIHVIYFDEIYTFGIGSFDLQSTANHKELFSVLIVFNIAFLVSMFCSRKIFNIEYNSLNFKLNNYLEKNNYILLLSLIFIILIIGLLNINFKIIDYYYFAEIKNHPMVDALLKWIFLFGFSSIFCIFLNLDTSKKLITNLFLISSLQEALFYFSILSRGCIFNSLAFLFALISKPLLKKKFSFISFFLLISFISFVFIFNFYILLLERSGGNKLNFEKYRNTTYIKEHRTNFKNTTDDNLLKNFQSLRFVSASFDLNLAKKINFIDDLKGLAKGQKPKDFNAKVETLKMAFKNRIFGMDTLMVVVGSSKNSFSFFKESLREKFNPGQLSFFDKLRQGQDFNINKSAVNITLPSILPFLYYTDSLSFVFISVFIIILIFNSLERFNIYLNNNIFLSALISQLIAYRLWHFGYTPANSYKFLMALLISIFLHFIVQNILVRIKILVK